MHQDRDHIHVHWVTNTVSYEDGCKLHNTRKDLEQMKQLTNKMCMERGLSVALKGKKVRDKKLSKTFNLNITRLLNEFERQNEIRIRRESDDELGRYCREVEAIIGGDYGVGEEREGEQCDLEKGKAEVAGTDCEVGERKEAAPRRRRRMAR